MSTRGVIARLNGDGFVGRYHHWDSYPRGLGKTLWDWAQQVPLDRLLKFLLDEHPAGWSTIVNTDPSFEPGYVNIHDENRKCVICGRPVWAHYRQYYGRDGRPPLPAEFAHVPKNVYLLTDHEPKRETFPEDSRPQCYCHGERHEGEQVVTDKNAASIGCEWAYVFDEQSRTMNVLSSYSDGHKMIGMFGMGDPAATWRLVASINLDGPEPDWQAIEDYGEASMGG